MSSIVIAGDTSGSVTLQAPAVAGSTVLNLPSTSGTIQTSGAGYTTNGVAYATSTSALATGSALTFDGANNFLLDATGTGGNQANLRVKTDTGGAVANGYFNINGTDYFRIYTTNSETGLRNLQNTPMFFSINNTEQMRLTSTGLGIGTSSPVVKLDVYGSGAYLAQFIRSTSGVAGGGITIGNQSRTCTMFTDSAGWSVYDNTAAAQRMLLDSAGNLGLGVTPSAWGSGIKAIDVNTVGSFVASTGSTLSTLNCYYNAGWKYKTTGTATYYDQTVGTHAWYTAASGTAGNAISFTQAMTLTSGGRLVIGTTSTSAANEFLRVYGSNANWIGSFENTNANPYGNLIQYTSTINGTGNEFLGCYEGGGGSTRLTIRSNGGIANYSANNVNLSDRREKTNFTPAKSYLDVICAIPVQTFNYIDQNLEEDDGLTLGVVAQDVQAVAPELVLESNWSKDGEQPKMRLSIYQTDLQYALMKALQELNAKFEEYKATHP